MNALAPLTTAEVEPENIAVHQVVLGPQLGFTSGLT
jgi:hypothetical protein